MVPIMDHITNAKIMGTLEAALDTLTIGILYDKEWRAHMSNRIPYLFQRIKSMEVRHHVSASWKRYQNEMYVTKVKYWRTQGSGSLKVKEILCFIHAMLHDQFWEYEVRKLVYFTMERQEKLRWQGKLDEADRLVDQMRATIKRVNGT